MSRWKASGIHLSLSAAIAAAVFTFMLTVWFPWPLFEAAGGDRLIFILVAVDATLGPLITLIIFKSGKKGLKLDLAIIALLQFSALAYGIHTVYLARPVYLVFTVDRFDLITAKDLDPADLAKVTRPEFKQPSLGRPQYIAAQMPSDSKESSKILDTAFQGKDLQMYPQYYVPYESMTQAALQRAKPLDALLKRDPEGVKRYLEAAGKTAESVKYLPLRAKEKDGAVLLDAATGAPLKILLVNPW
jgi:hypothetical protein